MKKHLDKIIARNEYFKNHANEAIKSTCNVRKVNSAE